MLSPCYAIEPSEDVRRPTRKQLKAIVRKAAVAQQASQPDKQTAAQPAPQPVPQPFRQFSKPPKNTASDRELERKCDENKRILEAKDKQIAALKRQLENHPKEMKMRLCGIDRLATFAANIRLPK